MRFASFFPSSNHSIIEMFAIIIRSYDIGCPVTYWTKKKLNIFVNFQPNELIFSEDNTHNDVHIYEWVSIDTHIYAYQ